MSTERLKGIEVFVAIAEAGSFTAAAERLHLTTSAVSKSIARLEARLGARLFERTTRRLALTSAGEAFHRTCTRIMADLEAAEIDLAAEHTEPAGQLRVDLPVTFGHLHVLPLLLDFAERHPRVKLHTSLTDRFVDPVEEGIDLAVRIGDVAPLSSLLAHRTIGRERVIFCAAPRYLAQRPAIRDVEDLEQHDCVTYGRADGSVSPWVMAGADGQIRRRTMNGRIIVGSGEAQVQAVKAGFGVAQLATWMIRDALRSGELVDVLPASATTGLPVNLIWPRHRERLPKVSAMLEFLDRALRVICAGD
ncbi:LysR family transcriptional regulator [Burkholderia sp. Ac-20353]|uniref:LysR family transcriptional regulator n=1 Tax=Burkholderia sp. Ac-20353 TaxID=2703894 RepID=UPI00197C2581|nr:LysR family transcriptional regulator [Burkholderia sp. Ac-20353]